MSAPQRRWGSTVRSKLPTRDAGGRATFGDGPLRLSYQTQTRRFVAHRRLRRRGLRREHATCDLSRSAGRTRLTLEVDGARCRSRLAVGRRHSLAADARARGQRNRSGRSFDLPIGVGTARRGPPAAFGHAHLDLAWLWTYADTKRKAFARLRRHCVKSKTAYVFAQSMPQFYAWVETSRPNFRAAAGAGRKRLGRGRRDDVGRARPPCAVRRIDLRQFASGMRLCARKARARTPTRGLAARHLRLSQHVAAACNACRCDGVRNDQARMERHDALAVPQFIWRGRRQ